jgi:hypothetical protein
MLSFLHQKIKIKKFKVASAVFSGLFVFSFAIFSFADTQSTEHKNIFQDADQDGLSTDEEKLYGTNPDKADTDGDGYSDGTEVKSGYDPLKKAPGDKLVNATMDLNDRNIAVDQAIDVTKNINLTEEVSRQVTATLQESAAKKQSLSADDLRDIVQKTMSSKITPDVLPEIDVKSIKTKKQNYSHLSEADRVVKLKEDNSEYVTAVSYILVNTSPIPMQADNDMQTLASFIITNSMGVFSGNNPKLLDDFVVKGDSITAQLQDVTVPEDMLPIHMKALRLAQYAKTFKKKIQSSGNDDPLAQMNSFAQIQGLIGAFADLANDIQKTLNVNSAKNPVS